MLNFSNLAPNVINLVSMASYGWIIILGQQMAIKYGPVTTTVYYLPIALLAMTLVFMGFRVAGIPYMLPEKTDYRTFLILGLLYALGQSLNMLSYYLGESRWQWDALG